jgi:hypothetical protein
MRLKSIFKFLLITIILVVCLLSGAIVYAYLNLNQFRSQLLEAVNKQLVTEVDCKEIELDLFKQFPLISIGLKDLSIKDPLAKNQYLLKASSLNMGLDFFNIVAKKYTIESLLLSNAAIQLCKDSTGKFNYFIVKETSDHKEATQFQFNLKKVQFLQVQFHYTSLADKQTYNLDIEDATLAGAFNENEFTIQQELKGKIARISINGMDLVTQKSIETKLKLNVNSQAEKISLADAAIKISDLNLYVNGTLTRFKSNPEINCEFNAKQTTIQELLSLLPIPLPPSFKALDSKGKVYFSGNYNGRWHNQEQPLLNLYFGVQNGSLSNKKNGLALNQINFEGKYESKNKQNHFNSLQISNFTASLNNEPVSGDFDFRLDEQPIIVTNLKGRVNLNDFQKWAQIQSIKEVSGYLSFQTHLQLFKEKNQFVWTHPNNQISLQLEAPILQLKNLNKAFKNVQLSINANQSSLLIQQMKFLIGQTDISGRGSIANVFQSDKDLQIQLVTSSANLNAEDLMIYAADKSDTSSSNRKFEVLLTCQADAFQFRQLQSTNCLAELKIEPGQLAIQSLQMQCWDGELKTKGNFLFSPKGYQFNGLMALKRVKVKQLLASFDDFNQKAIQSTQIDGSIGVEADLEMKWDQDFNFNKPAFKAIAKLKFKDGQLNQYEPLYALSKFVDLEALKNLKFKELENTLEIKQEQVTIPEMYIQTNAMNLLVSGQHTFDNVLDYRLKITLSDILNKKRKVQSNEFGEEDEKPGQINLFLRIKGPANHLKFTYDHKAVKEKISQELKKEGTELKEILKKEFGFKKDSSIKEKKQTNDNQDELEFEKE